MECCGHHPPRCHCEHGRSCTARLSARQDVLCVLCIVSFRIGCSYVHAPTDSACSWHTLTPAVSTRMSVVLLCCHTHTPVSLGIHFRLRSFPLSSRPTTPKREDSASMCHSPAGPLLALTTRGGALSARLLVLFHFSLHTHSNTF